jgi:nicotinamide mononucleotide transporter
MFFSVLSWLLENWVEVLGAVSGVLYLVCSIRQSIFLWPLSIASSLMYMFVFFHSAIYANMILQGYFLVMGIYGWYYWRIGGPRNKAGELPVSVISGRIVIWISLISLILFILLYLILHQTDSPVPALDAFTTALSISATWLLARKIIEQWFLWVIVDLVSVVMYISQSLWLTSILYSLYVVMAIIGYFEWRKTITTGL